MTTTIQQLAQLASGVSFDQLPAEVVREARHRVLDALGCMLGGMSGEPVAAARAVALGGPQEATLVGDGRRTSAAGAALANGTALRYLDYMDGHPGPYPCHPSLIIPPVLAVAEQTGVSGAEVVRAIVLGYELDIRLQLGAGDPDITAHGWSGSSNLGLAVPFALGGLLDLSPEQLAHAMAISAVHAPALDTSGRGQMAESKACVDGMVAMSAVIATQLARQGLTGPLAAFEGAGGFGPVVARRYDEAVLLAPLERFRILDVYTKRYNAVKCAQTAVAAALALRASLAGGWRDVDRVILRLAERDYRNQLEDEPARRRPRNRDTANHSAVYCVAAALVDGDLRTEQFEPRRLRDPDILGLIDRVTLAPDAALSQHWPAANPARVEIVTHSGEMRAETVLYSPGHPKNPLTEEQLEAKFRALAGAALAHEQVQAVIRLVRELDRLPSIRPLMELIGAPSRR